MRRCLVTGANGFIGSHLVESLAADASNQVYAIFHATQENIAHLKNRVSLHSVDLLERSQLSKVLIKCQATHVFHLAAASNVAQSWSNPDLYFRVNVNATANLLESTRKADLDPTMMVVCSGAEYGVGSSEPLTEESPLNPASPYAVSKVAQDMLAGLYAKAYGMKIVRVRPFLVIGPRRLTGACADFGRGIARIEVGLQDHLQVGNLSPIIDVLDVRDAVEGFKVVTDRGVGGDIYNLASGRGYSVRQLLDMLIGLARTRIDVSVDPKKFRPLDETILIGDNSKLRRLGWHPTIPIEASLKDVLDFWRTRIRQSSG